MLIIFLEKGNLEGEKGHNKRDDFFILFERQSRQKTLFYFLLPLCDNIFLTTTK
jgi:hypothetical protein